MVPIRWQCPLAVATRVYTAKSDVYSFGVLLFEIYSGGATPYAGLPVGELLQAVRAGERLKRPRPDTPADVLELMRQCTQLAPAARPSMATIHARLRGAWVLEEGGGGSGGGGGGGGGGGEVSLPLGPMGVGTLAVDAEESSL